MVNYGVSDQNKVILYYESGTYATPNTGTKYWPGLVTAHDPGETINVVPLRYVAGTGRNVNKFVQTSEEYDGSLSYHPQDWRFLKFALGSCIDGGSPTYEHRIGETNSSDDCFEVPCQSLPSFAIEDTHSIVTGCNLQRTMKGCVVDNMTINAPEGDMMSVDISYTAQQLQFHSGAANAVTERVTRPYLTSDSALLIGSPDIGPAYPNVKTWSLEIAENLSKPNYADGNRYRGKPIPTSRDYTLNVTLNEHSEQNKILYDKYFIGGSEFNTELRILTNSAALGSVFLYMSGCELMDMNDPTNPEGENEVTLVIRPTKINAIVYDNIQYYNNWSGVGF